MIESKGVELIYTVDVPANFAPNHEIKKQSVYRRFYFLNAREQAPSTKFPIPTPLPSCSVRSPWDDVLLLDVDEVVKGKR